MAMPMTTEAIKMNLGYAIQREMINLVNSINTIPLVNVHHTKSIVDTFISNKPEQVLDAYCRMRLDPNYTNFILTQGALGSEQFIFLLLGYFQFPTTAMTLKGLWSALANETRSGILLSSCRAMSKIELMINNANGLLPPADRI